MTERPKIIGIDIGSIAEIRPRSYFYPPLELRLSHYPEFTGTENYLFRSEAGGNKNDVIIPYLKYPRINKTNILSARRQPGARG